jgi:hypothetical protein
MIRLPAGVVGAGVVRMGVHSFVRLLFGGAVLSESVGLRLCVTTRMCGWEGLWQGGCVARGVCG